MRRLAHLAVALLSLAAMPLHAQGDSARALASDRSSTAAASPTGADTLLERLVGEWRMVGSVRGKPAAYALSAGIAFNAGWLIGGGMDGPSCGKALMCPAGPGPPYTTSAAVRPTDRVSKRMESV